MAVANLITDASLLRSGAWGWAGAVITDRGRDYFSAPGKVPVTSSNDAELLAIANTLHCAYRNRMIEPGETVLIQCDNLHAGAVFNFHFKSKGFRGLCPTKTHIQCMAITAIEGLLLANPGTHHIYVRHVKAHLSYSSRAPRNHVHEKVDELAGLAARTKDPANAQA